MRTPIAEGTVGKCPPTVLASVEAEIAVAKSVALLQVLGNTQLGQFDNEELDNYVTAGLGSLAHQTALDLVKAFNRLDAVVTAGRKL